MAEYSIIGKRIPRLEGIAKVTGEAKFTDDLILPRMLYGKILRSPHPHARILGIDISRAVKLPGVKAVITGEDVTGRPYGVYLRTSEQYPLAKDKVRYIGDEVAAVAAINEDIAQEAISLIKVDYKLLPAVFDPYEAMKPGSPKIHEAESNIAGRTAKTVGDMEKGFSESYYIREDNFKMERQAHGPIEPHSALASCDNSGRLALWTSNMSPFTKQLLLAKTLNKPLSDVRICQSYVGGAFGGKSELFSLDFCASLLSLKTGRPVKIIYSREEVFAVTRHKFPMDIYLKTGVKKDGALLAREARVLGRAGAYASTGIMAVFIACSSLFDTYKYPNLKLEGLCVYTNLPICGALRGHGSTQARFADESQMDIIAGELGLDPVEFRLKNAMRQGDFHPLNGKLIASCGLQECITKAAGSAGWKEKSRVNSLESEVRIQDTLEARRAVPYTRQNTAGQVSLLSGAMSQGIGMACTTGYTAVHISKLSSSAAFIKFNEDGGVNLLTGAIENGQGTETMLAQIAAEELGLRAEDIVVVDGDTRDTPLDVGSFTMALTFVTGNAVKQAASDAKKQVMQIASEMLEAPSSHLEAKNGRIYIKSRHEKGLSFAEVVRAGLIKGIPILGKGYYNPDSEFLDVYKGEGKWVGAYSFSTEVAEVRVDRETGQVNISGATFAQDCGRAINPMDVEGQIEGGTTLTHGLSLREEFFWEQGKLLNPSFLDYGMPTSLDTAPVKPIIVEAPDPQGPYGAKETGESSSHTGAAAIANAIYNAIGVRIKEIPISPEKILQALEEKKAKS